ncbi:hypothetical protein IWQ60_005560 [Tieghemiomyces parasiticus]|uniref:Uncharacterized protein n=1 Tax=Tieghemiomyces parasiticus TaxID=78921 RepID=A0A9W8A627_9FUNG|nr:hypothetical protein IWQ60_005560 [Tieghemiomyces parasiticus]
MSRQRVINDLLQLYSLDPKLSSFEIFDENGVMQIHVYIDYTLRLFKVHLTTLSTITFEFKPSDVHDGTYTDKATYVEERWWGTPLKFAKDGFIGWVCEKSRIFLGHFVHAVVPIPTE